MQKIIHAGALYEAVTHRNLTFYRKSEEVLPSLAQLPSAGWSGARIPVGLWRQILAFFKWSYDTTRSETQVRLFYNFDTGEWRAHAFPQEKGTGMTTRELPDHPNKSADDLLFVGFERFGSVHHHCSAPAFQSGTDRENEESQAGIHITVGSMDKKEHDLHSRISIVIPGEINSSTGDLIRPAQKLSLEPDLVAWFELPPELARSLPPPLHPIVMRHYLTSAAASTELFPDRWKENVIEVPRAPFNPIRVSMAHHVPMQQLIIPPSAPGPEDDLSAYESAWERWMAGVES